MLTQFSHGTAYPEYSPFSSHLNGDNNIKRNHSTCNYFIDADRVSEVIASTTSNEKEAKQIYFAPTIIREHYSIYENQPVYALKTASTQKNGYKKILGSLHGIKFDEIIDNTNPRKTHDKLTVEDLLNSIQFLGTAMQNLPYSQFIQGGGSAPIAVAYCGVLPLRCNAHEIKSGQEVLLSLPFPATDTTKDWRNNGWKVNLKTLLMDFNNTQQRIDFFWYPIKDPTPLVWIKPDVGGTTKVDEDEIKLKILMQKYKVGRCVKESKLHGYAIVNMTMDRGISSADDVFLF